MTIPLVILAALTVVSGGNAFLGESHHWFENRVDSQYLEAYSVPEGAETTKAATVTELRHDHHIHNTVMASSIGMFVLGAGLAFLFFGPVGPFTGRQLIGRGPLNWLYYCVTNLWFVDRFLVWLSVTLLHVLRRACGIFDNRVIDGFVNLWGTVCNFVAVVVGSVDYHGVDGAVRGIGESTLEGGRVMRRLQTGFLQAYVYTSVFIFAGVVLASILLIWANQGE